MSEVEPTTGKNQEGMGLSRRQLLAGTAVVGAVAGAGLVAGRTPPIAAAAKPQPSTGVPHVLMTITGSKTVFEGESLDFHGKTDIRDFRWRLTQPRDSSSGLPAGKRQHQPITFQKEWGAMTPQLFGALITGEVLPTVLFEIFNPDLVFKVVLTNARLADEGSSSALHTILGDTHELEEVSLTFEKIEMQNKDGKTMAQDDWHM